MFAAGIVSDKMSKNVGTNKYYSNLLNNFLF